MNNLQKRSKLVTTAAALIGTATIIAPSSHADQYNEGSEFSSSPIAVQGSFPNNVKNVHIYVEEPDRGAVKGEELALTPVKSDKTYVRGTHFKVAVSPESLPKNVYDDNGVVTFRVFGEGDAGTWMTVTSARAVHFSPTSSLAWVEPVASAAILGDGSPDKTNDDAASELMRPRSLVQRGITSLAADDAKSMQAVNMAAAESAIDEGFVSTESIAPMAVCNNMYMGLFQERSTTIGTSYPKNTSVAWLDIQNSAGGNYGIAFKSAGAANFSASGTAFKQNGWGKKWLPGKAGVGRSYRKGIEYRYYMTVCASSVMGYEWRPYAESGGTGTNTQGVTRPGWNTYCANVAKGEWYRNSSSGSTYKLGTGVKFASEIGIDLSVERAYNSSQKMTYDIRGGNPKKLCGDTGYPSYSGKQIERLR